MRFFSIIKWLIVCIFGFLFTVTVVIPLILMFVGYRVNVSSDKVAEIAAERKDVSLCKSILSYGLFIPQSGELRAHCIKTYASLTKDPSACALLMPSSYGWSCLGAAEKENARKCWFDFGPEPPEVGSGNSSVTFPVCTTLDNENVLRSCCNIADTLYISRDNTCSSFKNDQKYFDQCQELLAKREREISYCELIQDSHIQAACKVAVDALLKQNPPKN